MYHYKTSLKMTPVHYTSYFSHTFIVASSLALTQILNTGWKITLVTGLLCPDSENLSGGRGIHSPGSRLSRVGPPLLNSFSASANLASKSITYRMKYGQHYIKSDMIKQLQVGKGYVLS